MHPEPKFTIRDASTTIGIETKTDNAREMNPATEQIPALWQRFFQEDVPGNIPDKKPVNVPLGIYTDYNKVEIYIAVK